MQNKDENTILTYSDGSQQPPVDSGGVHAAPLDPDALSWDPAAAQQVAVTSEAEQEQRRPVGRFLHVLSRTNVVVLLLVLAAVGAGAVVHFNKDGNKSGEQPSIANSFNTTELPLKDIVDNKGLDGVAQAASVTVNGSMQLNGPVTIGPSLQPTGAKAGQLYFDKDTNQLAYFNGEVFVFLTSPEPQTGGVQSLGGATGQLTLGAGLSLAGTEVANSGVLSVQGETGPVTFTAGPGIVINGTTFANDGVISVTAGTPNVTIDDDGAGNVTISVVGAGTGTVASSGGTAGTIPLFTAAQNIENSIITQSGLNIAIAGSLSLGNALTVANGGTGATSLANNGVLIGQGTGPVTGVTAGGAGLCLMSTAGAPVFAACPGGGGSSVTSLNGLTGALTVANASAAGSTITINDATTAAKGIASFNSTNFTVVGGAVNTIQNINTGATPTFAGVNTNTITPGAALTVGVSAQTALLQGSTTTITSNGAGNNIVLNSAGTIELQDNTNVTGNVTLTGDIAVNGGDLTSSGALNITPGGALTAGTSGQTLTLQGNASTSLRATNGASTTIVAFTNPIANTTLNFPALAGGIYTICTDSGNCAGASTTLQGAYNSSTNPEIVLDATRGALTIRDNASPLGANLLEVQNNAGSTTYLAVTASGVAVTGTATVSGNINSFGGALQTNGTSRIDNSGNAVNIGNLTLSGAIAGGTTISSSGNINTTGGAIQTNSTTRIDNSGNLVNIASVTASGNATFQGGSATLGTNAQAGAVILNDGSSNAGTLQVAALGQNTVYTLPDPGGASATICLTTGNCAGSGGGVTTAGGTANRLAKFSGSQAITNSTITDDGTNVTVAVDVIIQGGDLTVGTTSQTASVVLHDGNGQTTTLQAGNSAGNLTFILPTNTGSTGQCLKQSGTGNQLVWDDCDGGSSGSSATLQNAYDNSSNPEIILNSGVGGLTIRDNSTPLGTNLFEIQNNLGSTTYLAVTVSGVSVTGTATATGNINSSGGALQTNGASRIDNSGNLVNIGNITGTGAITIASVGAGSDITINGADQFIVQDASVFNALSTFNANLNIGSNSIIGTTGDINLTNFDVVGATGNVTAGTYNGQTISSSANFTGTVTVANNLTLTSGDIAVNGGDITSTGALNVTPGGTLTVGATGQQLVLQGNASTQLTATSGGFTTTIGFSGAPAGALTYNFDRTITGTHTICTDVGNCAGVGGVGNVLQGGNSFGTAMTLGTNDAFALNLETSGVTRLTIAANGSDVTLATDTDLKLQGDSYISNPKFGTRAEAFGKDADIEFGGQDAVAVGDNAFVGTKSIAIGSSAHANSAGIALGSSATADADGSIAIGYNSNAGAFGTNTASIAIGVDAFTTTANQLVIGSSSHSINQVVIGNGVSSGAPIGFTLQATSAATGQNNLAGASVTIAGGQSTGSAAGGSIIFQGSLAGTSGSSQNGLSTLATLSTTDMTFGTDIDLILQGSDAFISNSQGQSASEAFGDGALVTAGSATAVGNGAQAASSSTVAIGSDSTASGQFGTAVGDASTASTTASTALGHEAVASGDHATAIGAFTTANNAYSIALGIGATTTADHQMVVGGDDAEISQVVIGNGVSSGAPIGFTLQATSAEAGQTNLQGADVTIAGGQGTGNAAGGSINFQIAGAGTTGSLQNALTTVASISGTDGSVLFRNAANSAAAFNIQTNLGNNLFTVDTANSRIGINLSGTNTPSMVGNGLEIKGGLRFTANGSFDDYTAPSNSTYAAKINIANTDPGSFGSLIAGGIESTANATARGITLFDARTSAHNQTLAVLSPDEGGAIGFNWNGSNTNAIVGTNDITTGGTTNGVILQSGNVSGGNGSSGDVFINTGSIAGGTGGSTGTIFLVSGTGTGTNSSSGNVVIDSGGKTGSGTAGVLNIGITNASAITIGRSGLATATIDGAALNIGSSANAHAINVGTGAAAQTVSIGSTNSTSSTTIQGGSGNITLNTSTGNKVQIGSSTTDATSNLLVLDSYNNATDPTGQNGAMYYNTSLGKFRCYQNGTWSDCISASGGFVSLQNAYFNSTGGTTPEILLDSIRKGLDIQDANGGIGASEALLAVRGSATSTTLGTAWFQVLGDGRVGINGTSVGYQLSVTGSGNGGDALKLQGANGSSGTNGGAGGNVLTGIGGNGGSASAIGASGGNGGTFSITTGNGGDSDQFFAGIGGDISLTAGEGGDSFSGVANQAGHGGNISLQAGNGGGGGFIAGGVAGSVSISAGNGGPFMSGGNISLFAGNPGAFGTGYGEVKLWGGTVNIQGDTAFQVQDHSSSTYFSVNQGTGLTTVTGTQLIKTATANSATAFQIQDSTNVPIFNANTTNGQITVTGKANNSQLVIKDYASKTDSTPQITFANSSGSEISRINMTGNGDIFLGWLTGSGINTSGGGSNIGIGSTALQGVTTGGANIAIGANNLSNLLTGGSNTTVGVSAGQTITGSFNTAIGKSALGRIGNNDSNVALGVGAGDILASAGNFYFNTFLGYNAGSQDDDSFVTLTSLHESAAIGHDAQVQANNTIVLGSIDDTPTKIVVGSTMPVGSNIFGVSPLIYKAGTACQGATTACNSSGSTITGNGTTWTAAMVGMRFIFANGTDAGTITAFNSPTSLTVSTSQTVGPTKIKYRIHNTGFQVTNTGDAYIGSTSTTAFRVLNASSVPQFAVDTTNSRVYIGNPTADSTGALLVLDTKNTSGDPTGVNGAMYYNSSSNTFRCYQNSVWRDCLSPISRIRYKTADESVSNNTLQNDDHIAFTYEANKRYSIIGTLYGTSPTLADMKLQWTYSGTVQNSNSLWSIAAIGNDDTFYGRTGAWTTFIAPPSIDGYKFAYDIRGTFKSDTAGTLQLQWSEVATSGTATLYEGSWVQMIEDVSSP